MSANDTTPLRHVFPSGPPFDGIVAAFTTRHPGRSSPPFGSLNTGLHTGDDPVRVAENRRIIFDALGLNPNWFTAGKQVHGDHVCRVTARERGRGAVSYEDAMPATDALITNTAGIPIGVFTADCVPIFLYDPGQVAVGIAHAGWRSTALSVACKAVRKMCEEFGSNPGDMWAAFGPSIGPCCYEVARDVYDAFNTGTESLFLEEAERTKRSGESRRGALSPDLSLFRKTGEGKWHLDLWLANRRQLVDCGLGEERIIVTGVCSACNSDEYFSARKLGPRTGRTLSVIAIKPSE
ncbi:MAG: peptidoglycan editing factor PgeF [Candidatus Hydrogenedentota bacterium]|nr:MAG: peptidoglycan editing factor PgeF [Candidatus Hydrogenedentota bacterium]